MNVALGSETGTIGIYIPRGKEEYDLLMAIPFPVNQNPEFIESARLMAKEIVKFLQKNYYPETLTIIELEEVIITINQ